MSTKQSVLEIGHNQKIQLPKKGSGKGLKIQHRFSHPKKHPYDGVQWVRKKIEIMDWKTGKPAFSRDNVEVPANWSDNSIRIVASKYLFGNKPGEDTYEDSFKHAFDRIANTYTVWGWKNGYFATQADALAYNWEIKALLVQQIWAPNSPVWFNLGHWEQWRWGRPDLRPKYAGKGNKAFKAYQKGNSLTVKALDNTFEAPQSSACFLTEIEDSMESILEHQITEGRVFASGSGAGLNLSTLRSSFEPISGKGKSSGPIPFNKGWDRMAGAIKSGGKTRRAARMVLMDSSHPNVFEFLNLKNDQEDIAKILLKEHNSKIELKQFAKDFKATCEAEELAKLFIAELPLVNEKIYDGSMDGEIYGETISDQNANHSISLLDDFWYAYWNNEDYATRWVTDPQHVQDKFPAKKLLHAMSESVWRNAEPGNHNNDWINLWNPVKSKGRINTSNPCSEYIHLNNTSCNLSSFNAYRFLKQDKTIDVDLLHHGVRLAMIAADLNIEECGFPDPKIAVGTYSYRTTGIGYGNIGGLLMALGVPYDSDEGRFIAALLVSHLTATCWKTSQELGEAFGTYFEYPTTKEDLAQVIRLHKAAHETLLHINGDHQEAIRCGLESQKEPMPTWGHLGAAEALEALTRSFKGDSFDDQRIKLFGSLLETNPWKDVNPNKPFRNSFVSLTAPGGTISAALGIFDQGTTSIEPDYTLVKYKTLAGGGSITMFNSLALQGLETLGYSPWHVKEAALEVAGLSGLLMACNGNIQETVEHLTHPTKATPGPIRKAFHENGDHASPIELVAALSEGQKTSLPLQIVSGVGNVEGIPWLSENHKQVFDCAATLGGGTRCIEPLGHIRMLGAIQPFLSGASSKTCNLPHSATVEDIVSCFEQSHKMGVKCIALYRDGSKGVSVYASDSPEALRWQAVHQFRQLCDSVQEKIDGIKRAAAKPKRQKLPGRRDGHIVKFEINGQQDGFLIVGVYPDGRCGEVFGRLGQGGSFGHGMFESFCKAFSVMLQWGVPLPDAVNTFRNMAFDPSGFVKVAGSNSETDIKSCKSVVDLMMRILAWLFPESNGYCLRDKKEQFPEKVGENVYYSPSEENPNQLKLQLAAAEECPECGSLALIQDGKCKRCTSCGYSGGGCGG